MKKNLWIPASAGMTKKQTLKNVIPRLDRGIQGDFNCIAKGTTFIIMVLLTFVRAKEDPPLKGGEAMRGFHRKV
jgi:hypothetical protein